VDGPLVLGNVRLNGGLVVTQITGVPHLLVNNLDVRLQGLDVGSRVVTLITWIPLGAGIVSVSPVLLIFFRKSRCIITEVTREHLSSVLVFVMLGERFLPVSPVSTLIAVVGLGLGFRNLPVHLALMHLQVAFPSRLEGTLVAHIQLIFLLGLARVLPLRVVVQRVLGGEVQATLHAVVPLQVNRINVYLQLDVLVRDKVTLIANEALRLLLRLLLVYILDVGLEISLRAKAGGALVALVADAHVLRLHVLLEIVLPRSVKVAELTLEALQMDRVDVML